MNHPTRHEKLKVLIADDVHAVLPQGLEKAGFNVLYLPNANRAEIIAQITDAAVLVIRTKTRVDREVIDAGKQLKVIARAGAGMDNVDEDAAAQRNIHCINAGEANADAVGEHTLGMLLMLLNNLSRAHAQVKQSIWLREENRGVELKGKTVAIIGYGNTGAAVARKLKGMEVKVLAYDKYKKGYGSHNVLESTWEEIYRHADILSFHVPLTAETHHYLNPERLNAFAKPIWLLNLSRGGVVQTETVIQGLANGKILGAALDVLENEKPETLTGKEKEWFQYLCSHERVVLSPHIGGWTKESYLKISEVLLDKLLTLSSKMS